jgi:beta-N-acetylhexosaminidase
MRVTLENIQPYDGANDARLIVELWQTTLGQSWPLEAKRIEQVLAGPEPQHFVVREDGLISGFAATFISRRGGDRTGHLAAILVAPYKQNEGVGTALHETAMAHFRQMGVSTVQLGSITPRFWCGVPTNLPGALAFFRARGWELDAPVYDLAQDLTHYETPAYMWQRMVDEHIRFETMTSQHVTEALAFEMREFPNWLAIFEHHADLGDYRDLLVARDQDGQIVGSLIMYTPQSHPERADVIWQTLLGQEVGGIAAVGVAQSARGRGIGIAIVARASEILKEAGVRNCYIDWVELTDFYAKLGYEKWREYCVGWRNIS